MKALTVPRLLYPVFQLKIKKFKPRELRFYLKFLLYIFAKCHIYDYHCDIHVNFHKIKQF